MKTKAKDQAFTERVLLSLVFDVTELREASEQIRVKIAALAKEHGIKTVSP